MFLFPKNFFFLNYSQEYVFPGKTGAILAKGGDPHSDILPPQLKPESDAIPEQCEHQLGPPDLTPEIGAIPNETLKESAEAAAQSMPPPLIPAPRKRGKSSGKTGSKGKK